MGYNTFSKALGLHQTHSESHYLQMENTRKSGESSQEWLARQHISKGAARTHPGTHSRSEKDIKRTADLSSHSQGQCYSLHNKKETGQGKNHCQLWWKFQYSALCI